MHERMERFLDLFFPATCIFCGDVVPSPHHRCVACKSRADKLELMSTVRKRGLPDNLPVYAAYQYMDEIRAAILLYKNSKNARPEMIKPLADILYELYLRNHLDQESFDYIVHVPSSRKRIHQLGFDHTEKVARKFSYLTGIPLKKKCLLIHEGEKAQHKLKRSDRFSSAQHKYFAGETIPKEARVLLYDDIITTGATVNACAKVLRQCGAAKVTVLALASTDHPTASL